MTYISPILSNSLKQNNKKTNQNESHYNKIYEELTRHANDVKPNAAKAKMIKGGPFHAVQNTIKDGKNFYKAVKDGKLSDNNLGRINDLGMKTGALLIASFLASRAKTKTDAIMQFVGGATFFASMSLWPKLFINLPAKLVHGFDIGEKYVSAQGDEKDFFLDNQFLPWDAQPKDKLRRIGKRTGINYDSPNGEEKIQRKMQKTALQNRTLWMATAGFATPLLTAMVGNAVEPKIKNAVIESDYKKAKDIITPKLFYEQDGTATIKSGLAAYLDSAKKDVRNVAGIDELFSEYSKKGNVDDDFFRRLVRMLEVNTPDDIVKTKGGKIVNRTHQMFKDLDDYTPIQKLHAIELTPLLRDMQAESAIVDYDSLVNVLENFKPIETIDDLIVDGGSVISNGKSSNFDVKNALQQFSESSDKTMSGLKTILMNNGFAEDEVKAVQKGLKFDNTPFFNLIKEYNEKVLPEIRGRFKSYMNIFNSVMGSKTESKTTQIYLNELDGLLKMLNPKYEDLRVMAENGIISESTQRYLTKYFSDFAQKTKDLSPEEYEKALKQFLSVSLDKDLVDAMEELAKGDNIQSIVDGAKSAKGNPAFIKLNNAILGTKGEVGSLSKTLKNFKENKIDSLEAIKAKALICSNFERRVANGEFKTALEKAELILTDAQKAGMTPEQIKLNDSIPYKRWLEYARSVVYDGTVAQDACDGNLGLGTRPLYTRLRDIIYGADNFNLEQELLEKTAKETKDKTLATFDIKKIVTNLRTLNEKYMPDGKEIIKRPEQDYLRSLSFCEAISKYATQIYNNKSWARIFVPMTAALVAVTLLVQPLFGKIKKEFPEENKNGGAK